MHSFDVFRKILVTNLAPKFGALKIWSAACSTGAEAYSVGIISKKHCLKLKNKILATDIDETILKKAQEPIFKKNSLRNVSLADKQRYFQQVGNAYLLNDSIREYVYFQKQDLILDEYARGFHAILCRNVTIFLNTEAKEYIYSQMSKSLIRGGILFVGATEIIYKPESFGLKKMAPFIYEKI